MAGLAIQPHSRRDNRVALLVLGVIAAGSFGVGLGRQIAPVGPSPFPRTSLTSLQRAAPIPDATPAPSLQVAEAEPRPARRAAEPAPDDALPDLTAELPPPPAPPASATEAAGTDSAAVAPQPAPTPPASTPPPTPDAETPPV